MFGNCFAKYSWEYMFYTVEECLRNETDNGKKLIKVCQTILFKLQIV